METYLELLKEHLTGFEDGSELRETARNELAKGDDGVLKALLIVLCPRLKSVYYARSSYVPIEDEEGEGNASLLWLSRIVISHRDQDIRMWPPGLQSLRHLAVGVETGTPFESEVDYIYHPLFLAKIMNLPNLESIYLYGLGYREPYADHDVEAMSYLLTPGCSSVRHIYLENLEELDSGSWEKVVLACKTQVRTCHSEFGVRQLTFQTAHQCHLQRWRIPRYRLLYQHGWGSTEFAEHHVSRGRPGRLPL